MMQQITSQAQAMGMDPQTYMQQGETLRTTPNLGLLLPAACCLSVAPLCTCLLAGRHQQRI
jgi:hypothetical protein